MDEWGFVSLFLWEINNKSVWKDTLDLTAWKPELRHYQAKIAGEMWIVLIRVL